VFRYQTDDGAIDRQPDSRIYQDQSRGNFMNGEAVNMNGGSYVVMVVPVGRRYGVGSLCWSDSSAYAAVRGCSCLERIPPC
jgi:hypothetical protein